MPPPSRKRTNLEAAANRTDPNTAPPGSTAPKTTTTTTVTLDRRVWAELQGWMAVATVNHGRKVKIGNVGAALYELLLKDPELQKRVIEELT